MWKLQLPVTLGLLSFSRTCTLWEDHPVCLFIWCGLFGFSFECSYFFSSPDRIRSSLSVPSLFGGLLFSLYKWLTTWGWTWLGPSHFHSPTMPVLCTSEAPWAHSLFLQDCNWVLSVLDPQYLEHSGQLIKVYWMNFYRTLTELLLWFPWKGAICLVSG